MYIVIRLLYEVECMYAAVHNALFVVTSIGVSIFMCLCTYISSCLS